MSLMGKDNMQIKAGNLNYASNLSLQKEITVLKDQMLAEREQSRTNEHQLRSTIKSLEDERDSLLTAIRLLNTDQQQHQQQSSRNNPDHSPDKQPAETWTVIQSKAKRKERNEKKPPPPEKPTAVILGDSINKNVEGRKMSRSIRVINKSFPGSTVDDMSSYMKPTAERKPEYLILHTGTNNIKKDKPRVLAEKIVDLATEISSEAPQTKVIISGIIERDDPDLNAKTKEANKIVRSFCSQRGYLSTTLTLIIHISTPVGSILTRKELSH